MMQGEIPYQRLPIYGAFYWAFLFVLVGLLLVVAWATAATRKCPQCDPTENKDSLYCTNCGFPNPRHLGTCDNCGDGIK